MELEQSNPIDHKQTQHKFLLTAEQMKKINKLLPSKMFLVLTAKRDKRIKKKKKSQRKKMFLVSEEESKSFTSKKSKAKF